MFKVNEYVLYKYNVCKIREIINIHDVEYYVLNPVEDTSLVIKLPVNNPKNILREIICKKEALEWINKIPNIEEIQVKDHSLEQEYKRLMNTGDREDLVKIIKTTYTRNKFREDNGKKMGEKDSNYFNLAEKALYDELAISLDKTYKETKEFVIDTINNS